MRRQLKRQFEMDKENQSEFLELQDRLLWNSVDESSNSVQVRSKRKADQVSDDPIVGQQQQPNKRRKPQMLSDITNTISQSNPNNVTRRNERERNRVKLLNLGFDRLRAVVPCRSGEQLSKISTLKKAIWYIEHLDKVLQGQDLPGSNAVSTPSLASTSAFTTHPAGVTLENNSKQLAGIASSEGDQVGTGTSWPISTTTPSSTNCGKRSDYDRPPSSPIFPTYWDQQVIELTSTPKYNDTRQLAPVNLQSMPKSTNETRQMTFDSGYNTLGTSGTPQSLFDSSPRLWTPISQSTGHVDSASSNLPSRPERTSAIPNSPSFEWAQSVPQLQWFLRNSMFKTNS